MLMKRVNSRLNKLAYDAGQKSFPPNRWLTLEKNRLGITTAEIKNPYSITLFASAYRHKWANRWGEVPCK